jgi:hypothetical protein
MDRVGGCEAATLTSLATANEWLLLPKEGIPQAKESLEICKRLNNVLGQADTLQQLARLLRQDDQLDAAEEAASQSIDLLPDTAQIQIYQGHRALGEIYYSKGEAEKAINHFETALGIADSFNWNVQQSWILYSLAQLSRDQGRFDDAHAHVERAESHSANDAYTLGRVMELKAGIWYNQGKLEEAKSETLDAVRVFEKLGAATELERCRNLLRDIEEKAKKPVTSGKLCFDCEILETMLTSYTYQPSTLRSGNRVMSPTIASTSLPVRFPEPPTLLKAELTPFAVTFFIVPTLPCCLSRRSHPVSYLKLTSCAHVPFDDCCPTTRPLIYLRCRASLPPVLRFCFCAPRGLFAMFDGMVVDDPGRILHNGFQHG